jgi:hypothetical protein
MANIISYHGSTRIIEIGRPGRGWKVYVHKEYIDAVYYGKQNPKEYHLRPGTFISSAITARELRAIIRGQA